MFRRTILSTLGAFCLLATAVAPAFAWAGYLQGDPDNMGDDAPQGYYVWHNDNGWHIRTHGPDEEHHFTARLHTDGVFTGVDPMHFEDVDRYAVTDGGHTLTVNFRTFDRWDGVNFRVAGGDCLRFNLQLNGEEIPTDSIFLGDSGRHPDSDPFRVCR